MRFEISPATPADDAEIRRLLRTNPVPGRVGVTYEREPDYFLGCGALGRTCQVLVARERGSGELAGIVCRSTRPVWINGRPEEIGYLSGLRIDHRFRGRWLVGRGLRSLGDLDAADGRVEGYLAAITEENHEVLGVLVRKPRPGFPAFREAVRLYTAAIPVRTPLFPRPPLGPLRQATLADLPRIVGFLNEHGQKRQFSPVYTTSDFEGDSTPGFAAEDFLLFERDGALEGVAGLWDQSSFKQTVVSSYSGALRTARPFYNVALRLARRRPLPAPGQRLSHAFASFVRVASDDPDVFRELLRGVHAAAAKRGHAYLVAGFSMEDPLIPEVRRYPHVPYRSRLYTVTWNEEGGFHERLDGRVAHAEVSTL